LVVILLCFFLIGSEGVSALACPAVTAIAGTLAEAAMPAPPIRKRRRDGNLLGVPFVVGVFVVGVPFFAGHRVSPSLAPCATWWRPLSVNLEA
jgi:hypothetical protein